jgi:hypothetical protein
VSGPHRKLFLMALNGPQAAKRSSKRSFLREYFYDHPIRTDNSHLMGNPPNFKQKVYCSKCFDDTFLTLKNADATSVATQTLDHVRSDEILRNICELLINLALNFWNYTLTIF